MNLKTQKLGKSFKAHDFFKYRVQVSFTITHPWPNAGQTYYNSRLQCYLDFVKMRNWCWEQWGPSCEDHVYVWATSQHPVNLHWAWRNNDLDQKCYLYFRGDEELTFFNLSWI